MRRGDLNVLLILARSKVGGMLKLQNHSAPGFENIESLQPRQGRSSGVQARGSLASSYSVFDNILALHILYQGTLDLYGL
jgi:hypothetical protein